MIVSYSLEKSESGKRVDEYSSKHMEEELKIEELDSAIKRMPKGKSSGLDGLTVDFYTFFWDDIRELLYNAFLEYFPTGQLSSTMKQGIITLIPKPNKDRPITLLCTDYKLLAHVYSNRLDMGLNNIVDEYQSAFVKGRNLHNHRRLISDMLDYSDDIETDSLVLFLDFFKAFDAIEHPFLLQTSLPGLWNYVL